MVTLKSWQIRMAELTFKQKKVDLTCKEERELEDCLKLNANYVWTMMTLENLSLELAAIKDVKGQHEVCRRIEELVNDPHSYKEANRHA